LAILLSCAARYLHLLNKLTKNFKHRYICRCMSQIKILFNGISLGNSFSHSHAFSTNRQNSTMGLQCIPVPFSTNFCTVGANIVAYGVSSLVEHELLTRLEHMSSSSVFSGFRVTRPLVFCVVFYRWFMDFIHLVLVCMLNAL
jgi:hypothetical protein